MHEAGHRAAAEPPSPLGHDAHLAWARRVRAWAAAGVAPALVTEDADTTYAQLADAVERVAERWVRADLDPGDLVELRATRSPQLAAELLGAWEADAVVALTDDSLPTALLDKRSAALRPRAIWSMRNSVDATPRIGTPSPRRLGRHVGHVLHTSGTSGPARAVAVPAAALLAKIDEYVAEFEVAPTDRVALLGGLGHDPVLRDLLAPLSVGATALIPDFDLARSPGKLGTFIAEHRATVINVTPALAELLVLGAAGRRLDEVRLVVCAGARLTVGLLRQIRAVTDAEVVNAYGATETPQLASFHRVLARGQQVEGDLPDDTNLPVGTGTASSRLNIVDDDLHPVPIGEQGQVVVSSAHLADGYLDTGEHDRRFSEGRYLTGDLGRARHDGGTAIEGRMDRQTDIAGHRLELADVEEAALQHPWTRSARAVVEESALGRRLRLDVDGPTDGAEDYLAKLRRHLAECLPPYAVPYSVRQVRADEALPDIKSARSASVPEHPVGTLGRLDELVATLTGNPIPPSANFFDAGLNSMALIRLQAAIQLEIGVDLATTALFEHPTLIRLASHVDELISGPGSAPAPPTGTPAPTVDDEPMGSRARRSARRRELWSLTGTGHDE